MSGACISQAIPQYCTFHANGSLTVYCFANLFPCVGRIGSSSKSKHNEHKQITAIFALLLINIHFDMIQLCIYLKILMHGFGDINVLGV